jgi:hypothetical protein
MTSNLTSIHSSSTHLSLSIYHIFGIIIQELVLASQRYEEVIVRTKQSEEDSSLDKYVTQSMVPSVCHHSNLSSLHCHYHYFNSISSVLCNFLLQPFSIFILPQHSFLINLIHFYFHFYFHIHFHFHF